MCLENSPPQMLQVPSSEEGAEGVSSSSANDEPSSDIALLVVAACGMLMRCWARPARMDGSRSLKFRSIGSILSHVGLISAESVVPRL